MTDRPDTYWLERAYRLEAAIRYHRRIKQAFDAPYNLPDISDDYDHRLWDTLDVVVASDPDYLTEHEPDGTVIP